ncbi:MAG TPA: VWA domain-containing protein, partial [Dongiaceae bacterium]|nr:VWA domain-containing protein [Dongiaceae bacterium]
MQFARTLRAAGLPLGPGKAIDAVEAVKAVGIGARDDFYWTLHAVFVQRREQREIFDQAFHIFWRNPQFLQRMMSLMLPQFRGEEPDESHREISPRVAEALRGNQAGPEGEAREPERDEVEVDAALTFSSRELLQRMDFEKMTLAELEAAKKAIAAMRLPVEDVATRRFKHDARGRRVDMRATLRAGLCDP